MTRVAINGLGRIGRSFLRAALRTDEPLSIVAVNDTADAEQLAYLLEFDSTFGGLDARVKTGAGCLRIGPLAVTLFRQPDAQGLPWAELDIDVVVETTRSRGETSSPADHLTAGARVVLLSRPHRSADATLIVGLNEHSFDPGLHRVVSCGSCAMNCVSLLADVLDRSFGLQRAMATTVHAYTSEQSLVDAPHAYLRHGRAAAGNIIPGPDLSSATLGGIIPRLDGRVVGNTVRVPVPNGCLVELTAVLAREVSADAVNEAFQAAAADVRMGRVLRYSEDPLVSCDIVGRPASCTFDAPLTVVLDNLVRVHGWFDNEWSYASRLVDMTRVIGAGLAP